MKIKFNDILIIIAIVLGLCTVVVFGGMFTLLYLLEKDQPQIQKIVKEVAIEGLELDFCNENKCIYTFTIGICQKKYIFSYDAKLKDRVESLKMLSERDVCSDENI